MPLFCNVQFCILFYLNWSLVLVTFICCNDVNTLSYWPWQINWCLVLDLKWLFPVLVLSWSILMLYQNIYNYSTLTLSFFTTETSQLTETATDSTFLLLWSYHSKISLTFQKDDQETDKAECQYFCGLHAVLCTSSAEHLHENHLSVKHYFFWCFYLADPLRGLKCWIMRDSFLRNLLYRLQLS